MKSSEKQIEKVDQLFKNKLDDHAIMPSENAWARVEAELSKKNKWFFLTTQTSSTTLFWRSAAAILLVGTLASIVYWSQSAGEKENLLAKKSPVLNEKKQVAQTPTTSASKVESATQNKNDIKKANVNRFANSEIVAKKEVAQEKQLSESQKKIIEIEKEIATTYTTKMDRVDPNQKVSNEEKIKEQATPKAEVASIKQKPIKLEFTLEALPSEETVATTTEVKSTGIKKVLNLAREMKEGDGLSLREKKDELLANNFLTKRERNQ